MCQRAALSTYPSAYLRRYLRLLSFTEKFLHYLELATGIAPIRRESGIRGSLGLSYLVVNDSVHRAGLLRLGITGGVALFSWLIIFVMV